MRKFKTMTAIALASMMMLSGCSGNSAQTSTNADESSSIKMDAEKSESVDVDGQADILNVLLTSEPTGIEPGCSANTNDCTAQMQVYECLVMQDHGDTSTVVPLLAESWEFEDDGKVIVFKIKNGVKFHSGDELTAEDVAWSLNKSITLPSTKNLSGSIDHAEVRDDDHVELHLKHAFKPILSILVNPCFGIMNKSWYEEETAKGTNTLRIEDGTGPYILTKWASGDELSYEEFDQWHMGEPNFKAISLRIVSDATTGSLSVENGEADVLIGMNTQDRDRLAANPDIQILDALSTGYHFTCCNIDKEPFNNVKIRQAIAHAINHEEMLQGGLDGQGMTTDYPVTPGYFGYEEDFKGLEYDPELAKTLLAEAGYPDGFTTTIRCRSQSWYTQPVQVLQEQLALVGIKAEIELMETAAYDEDVVGKRNYDMTYYINSGFYPDADSIYSKRFCRSLERANMVGDLGEEVYSRVETAAAETDDEKRKEIYHELAEMNKENAWYIPIMVGYNNIVIRSDIKNAYGHSSGYYRFAEWAKVQ